MHQAGYVHRDLSTSNILIIGGVAKLADLEAQLAAAIARHEQALAEAKTAEDTHSAALAESEKLHTVKVNELSTEIQRLANELAVRAIRIWLL